MQKNLCQNYYGTPEGSPLHILNVAASSGQASGVFFSPVTRFARRRGGWFEQWFT